jgi:rhomboid protease GluP
MSNIHDFNNYSGNTGNVGIQNSMNSSSNSGRDDTLFVRSLYKLRSVTAILLILNIAIYFFQIISFYMYFINKKLTWSCLLISYGAFQAGKIKNHYQYHRFISSMFLHNSMAHMGSNCLSLFFLGFRIENEVNNKLYFFLLYMIAGLIGNFNSIIFNTNSISVGASGAIIGLCGNWVIYFLLNYKNMTERKRYSYGTMFLFLFINLFSGLAEGGENINMASHMGGFIGGFCVSIILTYRMNYRMQFQNKNIKKLYYCSIVFLVAFPIISIVYLAIKKVGNIADFICNIKN